MTKSSGFLFVGTKDRQENKELDDMPQAMCTEPNGLSRVYISFFMIVASG